MQLLAIILAGVSVAIADALIKKTSGAGSLWMAFRNPWMALVIILYFLQVVFFIYVFTHQWKLGIVGNLQMIFYSLTVVAVGYFIFEESLTISQMAGIILAVIAVFLINK